MKTNERSQSIDTPTSLDENSPINKFIVVGKRSAAVAEELSNPSFIFPPFLFRCEISPRSEEMRYCVSM